MEKRRHGEIWSEGKGDSLAGGGGCFNSKFGELCSIVFWKLIPSVSLDFTDKN